MADTATVAAPAAAPASTPAPAAPAASTPSPAAPAAPAAPATPAAAPAPVSTEGKSIFQVMQETQAQAQQPEGEAQATSEGEVPQTIPAPETAAPEGDPAAEAELAAAPEGEAAPADGEAAPPAEEDEFTYESNVALAPQALSEKIDGDPALKAALESNPELRQELFANARLAAAASEFQEVFATPQDAQVAAEGYHQYSGIRDLMGQQKAGDLASTDRVLSTMLEASYLRDAEGNPVTDADGKPQTDGSVGTFLRNAFDLRVSGLIEEAAASGDADTQAAAEHILAKLGLRQPSEQNEGEEMPAHIVQERERLRLKEQELNEAQNRGRQEAETSFFNNIGQRLDSKVDAAVKGLLKDATGLTAYNRGKIEADLTEALASAVKKSPSFKQELARINTMPFGTERANKHEALAVRTLNAYLSRVAAPILAEAEVNLKAQHNTKTAQQTARAEAARSETRGTMSATKPVPTAQTGAALQETAIANLRTKLGRSPNLMEIMAETRALSMQKAS